MRSHTGALLALLSLTGCGASFGPVHVLRRHVPPAAVTEPPAVGILQVHVDDAVLETAPEDFLHVSGLVVKAAKEHLAPAGIPVEDYVDLEDAPVRWTRRPAEQGHSSLSLEALPPLPFGVRTPLVTLVEVWEWKVEELGQEGGVHKDQVAITLLLSTWSRQGEPVLTEMVYARAQAGGLLALSTTGDEQRVDAYLGVRKKQPLPNDTKALFWTVLREAVGLHYASHLPYFVPEELSLQLGHAGEQEHKDFLFERFDRPLRAWKQTLQADPLAHGAFYNAALVYLIRGEDEQALPLLERAVLLEPESVYLHTLGLTRARVAAKRAHGLSASERDARASTRVPDWRLPR